MKDKDNTKPNNKKIIKTTQHQHAGTLDIDDLAHDDRLSEESTLPSDNSTNQSEYSTTDFFVSNSSFFENISKQTSKYVGSIISDSTSDSDTSSEIDTSKYDEGMKPIRMLIEVKILNADSHS